MTLLLFSVVVGSVGAVLLVPNEAHALTDAEKALALAAAAANQPLVTAAYVMSGIGDKAVETVATWIVNTTMWVMARALYFSGIIFNYSVDYSLNFSKVIEQVPLVDIGWKVLRDISNIVFIFIALWSGISITLGIRAEKAWGLLAQMVVVALFINFSLFITKAVIDTSNIAALHFYRLMISNPCKDGSASCVDENGNDTLPSLGLSDAFMNGLRLETIYDAKTIGKDPGAAENAAGSVAAIGADAKNNQLHPKNIFLIGIFGSIVMLIAAFVFFAAAILFVIRTVTLLMLMILSPLAFVAWLLPGAQKHASDWWHKLWSQAFFAPLYMALAYVVVSMIQSDGFKKYLSDASFASAFTSTGASPSSVGVIFNFILICGLLIGCLIIAQSMGAAGSGMVMNFGKAIVGGATGAAGRFAVRGTYLSAAGGLANAAGWMAKKMGADRLSTRLYGGGTALEKAGRKIDVGELDKRFGRSAFGRTAIGNFIREETTGRVMHAKFGGKRSVHEAYELDEQLREKRDQSRKIESAGKAYQQLTEAVKALTEALKSKDKAKIEAAEKTVNEARSDVFDTVNKISANGFADMTESQIEELIPYANFGQVKAVYDSKQWTQDEKEKMIQERWHKGYEEFEELEKKTNTYDEEKKQFDNLARDPSLLSDPTQPIKLKKDGTPKYVDANGFVTTKTGVLIKDKAGNTIEPPKPVAMPKHLQQWAEKLLTVPEFVMMANIKPELFKLKTFGRAISFNNTHRELRRNENISPGLREEFSFTKDSKVIDRLIDTNSPLYMPKDTEKTRTDALVKATTAAEAAAKAAKAASKEAAEIARDFDSAFEDTYAEETPADTIRLGELRSWAKGRTSDELGNGRGKVRKSEAVSQVTTPKVLQTLAGRDLDDLRQALQHLVSAYRDEKKGIGKMTDTARETLKWLVGQSSPAKQMPKPDEFKIVDARTGKETATIDTELQAVFKELQEEGRRATKNWKIGLEQTRDAILRKI